MIYFNYSKGKRGKQGMVDITEIIFDMDGTIADLYNVDNWMEKLRKFDVSPYAEAQPMYDMDILATILNIYKGLGVKIKVVSWGSMTATREYNNDTRKVKQNWLDRHNFPYDELHVVKYGTPKVYFTDKNGTSLLIDDSMEVRTDFMKSTRAGKRQVMDATQNILKQLVDMLVES